MSERVSEALLRPSLGLQVARLMVNENTTDTSTVRTTKNTIGIAKITTNTIDTMKNKYCV